MSDILIKNMKTPDCCFRCPFKNHDGMWVRCIFTGQNVEPETRRETKASSCPLIEVPAPHGRLIDAGTLDICKREQQAWQDYEHDPDDEYLEGVKDGLHEASKQLSTAMTIIEKEGK